MIRSVLDLDKQVLSTARTGCCCLVPGVDVSMLHLRTTAAVYSGVLCIGAPETYQYID